MKVLLVNKFHYIKGGSETYYFGLAEALKRRGHEAVFFSVQDEKNVACEQDKYFVTNRSTTGSVKSKLNLLLHMMYSREAYRKMKQLLREEKPDLVILNLIHKHITLSVVDAIRAYDPSIPIFWIMHDLSAICPAYTMRNGRGEICEQCLKGDFKPCVKNGCIKGSKLMSLLSMCEAYYIRKKDWYNQVDLYICPSEFYRKKFVESGFSRKPVITQRNLLPIGTNYGICGKEEGYILYFGRLSYEKGVKTLIDAANKTGCRLVIVGTGPKEAELKQYASENPNIQFMGFQSGKALQAFVSNSRCVVLPSEWYENGPYSAMEAMAMGKPLIVSNNGGLPELVEEGKNGYICQTNADSLAEAIQKILHLSEEEYNAMAQCALDKAMRMFDADLYITEIENWYQKIKSQKS